MYISSGKHVGNSRWMRPGQRQEAHSIKHCENWVSGKNGLRRECWEKMGSVQVATECFILNRCSGRVQADNCQSSRLLARRLYAASVAMGGTQRSSSMRSPASLAIGC
jgi:hypothetical protein